MEEAQLSRTWLGGIVILAQPDYDVTLFSHPKNTPGTAEVTGIYRSKKEVMVGGVKSTIREHSITGKMHNSGHLRGIKERFQTIF